jgi:hypothetical protein
LNKNSLILTSTLLDYDLKEAGQKEARRRGLTFAKLLNRALAEYLTLHTKDPYITEQTIKQKPVKCQIPNCTDHANAAIQHISSGKQKKVCENHLKLYCTEENLKKNWKTTVEARQTEKSQ